MQKLYEQIALGLSRTLTISREDLKREDGQGAVEYALVVLGIAAVIFIAAWGQFMWQQRANFSTNMH